jgi:high-affinity iron transporter
MLPTFVIGLREGLEAALIVGIIAAFLRKQGRRDLLRSVLLGVAAAVVLCLLAGVALELYSRELPQREQEGLETVIGILAVGMVTYMVVWMRRHSRELKGQLEGLAADAISGASPAGRAMIAMAFLAVIREGLETVVFLLAAFNEAGSGPAAGTGAAFGIIVAIALGYGIYRGGVRLNLSKFFRATGLVLVLVAAGLVVNALHTAHEAGWLDAGQGSTVDLSWLVRPGTVQASLLTGMLGVQSHPVVIELVGWLLYLIPVACYVAWPPSKAVPMRAVARWSMAVAGGAAVLAAALAFSAPAKPDVRPMTSAAGMTAAVVERSSGHAVVSTQDQRPVKKIAGSVRQFRLVSIGDARHADVLTEAFQLRTTGEAVTDRPARLSVSAVAALNHGRLPLGIRATAGAVAASYHDVRTLTVWLDARTDRVIDLAWDEKVLATVGTAGRVFALESPVASARVALPATAVAEAAAAARAEHATLDRRSRLGKLALTAATVAGLACGTAAASALTARRRLRAGPAAIATRNRSLVHS